MKSEKYVFISYSREDSNIVKKISKDLQKEGVSVWLDVEKLFPGENWASSINEAIKKATAYIYILSKNSLKSKWVVLEQYKAVTENKTIIPVVIDEYAAKNIPPLFKNIQWADFSESYNEGFRKLLQALSPYLNEENKKEDVEILSDGYVFISYSTRNIDFVESLATWLKDERYGYFDYHSSKRNYHTLFFLELEEKINNSSAILSIISPEWKQSKWAVREFLYAEAVEVPIFLLHVKETEPCLLTMGIPYIDFIENETRGFEELKREITDKGL